MERLNSPVRASELEVCICLKDTCPPGASQVGWRVPLSVLELLPASASLQFVSNVLYYYYELYGINSF